MCFSLDDVIHNTSHYGYYQAQKMNKPGFYCVMTSRIVNCLEPVMRGGPSYSQMTILFDGFVSNTHTGYEFWNVLYNGHVGDII